MKVAFSDSDPLVELSIFCLVWLTLSLAVNLPKTKAHFQSGLHRVGKFVLRTPLFEKSSLRTELFKIDCMRVLLSLVIAHHLLPQFVSSYLAHKWLEVFLNGSGVLLCVFICLGLATPWACMLLALTLAPIIDNFCQSSNLGSVFASQLLWLFAFGYAGWSFSLDKWLPRKFGLMRTSRVMFDKPSLECIAALKFIVLAIYGLVCWESAWRHSQAQTWKCGEICGLIMASPTTNPLYFAPFADFYRNCPIEYILVFKLVTYLTLIWMAVFPLPIFVGGIVRRLALVFWLLFILTDTFVLPLMGNLGAIQLIVILTLFSPNCFWRIVAEKFGFQSAHHTHRVRSVSRITSKNYSPITIGYAVSIIVFSIVFCLRSPALDGAWMPAKLSELIKWERQVMGQSFLAAGLTNLDVFNDFDRRVIFRKIESTYVDCDGKIIHVRLTLPDAYRAQLLQIVRSQEFFCYEPGHERVLTEVASYLHLQLPRMKMLTIRFNVIGEPDFSSLQPDTSTLNKKLTICTVNIDPALRKVVSVSFDGDGMKYAWRHHSRTPNIDYALMMHAFPVTSERVILNAHKIWLQGAGKSLNPELEELIDYSYDFGIPGPQPVAFLAHVCAYGESQKINPDELPVSGWKGDEPNWKSVESAYRAAFAASGRKSKIEERGGNMSSKERALAVRREYFNQIFSIKDKQNTQLSSQESPL